MKFRAILLEGLFFQSLEGDLSVRTEAGEVLSVGDRLRLFVGESVQLAYHHLPSAGLDPEAWGWGSCLWKPAECPAGHHLDPKQLFNASAQGLLQEDPWRLHQFDGSTLTLDFSVMPGHYGRLAAAMIPDVEKMREELEKLSGLSSLPEVSSLAGQVGDLKLVLERLRARASKSESEE
jgi:hypothetical protein